MSYRKKHIKRKVRGIKPKKSIFMCLWFWITVLAIIILLTSAYFVLFYDGVQIKNIEVSGNQKVSTQDIKNLISEGVNNKFFKFDGLEVSSSSIFLADTKKLNAELSDKYPTIKSAKIKKKWMQTLNITLVERVPSLVFCPSLDTAVKCYFADNDGVIFEPLYVMPENIVIVRQVIDNSQITAGQKVIQNEAIDLIFKTDKNLKDKFQIGVSEVLIASNARINIKTSEGWKIYFDLSSDQDINYQLTKLDLLLTEGISPEEKKNLRYIDLRLQGRAVICDNSICGN